MRLVLVSPHRDEIREEFARAFPDWFQARMEERALAARAALTTWLDATAPDRQPSSRALQQLLADWRQDELPELRDPFRRWEEDPTRQTGQALLDALKRWQPPPIELVWQDVGGGTSQIVRYVNARFQASPGGIGVDLFFGGGTDTFLRLAEQGYLEKIDIPESILKRIRPEWNGIPLYDPGGRWYGPMLSSFGILYNRRVLERIGEPEPRHWADLGRPGLQGWVSAGDPRMTGSVHMVYEIILQGLGWDSGFRLLMRLGANTHSFIRDSGTLTRTVASGETAVAGNLDANALSAVGHDPENMAFRLPARETIINPDAMAVLKGAPRKELARAFVEFALSDAGQRLILLRPGQPGGPKRYPLCRLSVVEKLYQQNPPETRSVGAVDPFALGDTIQYNNKGGVSRWDALNDLFGAWVIDAHPELSAAWRAVRRSGLPAQAQQRLEEELFAPPCSEADLAAYARRLSDEGPRMRTETLTRWGEQASQRYRGIRREAASR